jgi:acetyl esterase/lipase
MPVLCHTLLWISLSILSGWELRTSRPDPRSAIAKAGITLLEGLVYRIDDSYQASVDIYLPKENLSVPGLSSKRAAVLAIHGGSWRGGTRTDYRSDAEKIVIRLARQGLVVVAVDYRLARPNSPNWPLAIEDLREAVRWTRRHALGWDIDPDRIVALGQSSGAHLAMLLGTLPDEPGPDGISSKVRAVVGFYGPTDLARLIDSRHLNHDPARLLIGNDEIGGREREFAASPLHQLTNDDAPMLLLHGSDDTWVRPDQSSRMADALASAGVRHRLIIVDGARHGFEATVKAPVERDLLPEILAFLESVWNVSIGKARTDSRGGR